MKNYQNDNEQTHFQVARRRRSISLSRSVPKSPVGRRASALVVGTVLEFGNSVNMAGKQLSNVVRRRSISRSSRNSPEREEEKMSGSRESQGQSRKSDSPTAVAMYVLSLLSLNFYPRN